METNYLECPVCLCIASNAVEVLCCNRIYCEKCVNDLKKYNHPCAMCQKLKFDFKISILAQRMIGELPAECEFCKQKTTRSELSNHQSRCPEILMKC